MSAEHMAANENLTRLEQTTLWLWNELRRCEERVGSHTRRDDMKNYLERNGCEWKFNPSHASQFGGVWKRMIGIPRKILHAMFGFLGSRQLTHKVLSTLMAEIIAIICNSPLIPVSNYPSAPEILIQASILSRKSSAALAAPEKFTQKDRDPTHVSGDRYNIWQTSFCRAGKKSTCSPSNRDVNCKGSYQVWKKVLMRDKERLASNQSDQNL